MSEIKINEHLITKVIEKSVKLMEEMVELIDELKDQKTDIFDRYRSMQLLMAAIEGVGFATHQINHGFRFGFDMHHPLLQGEKAKEKGWDEVKLENNPFFTSKNEKDNCIITSDDLPDEIKEMLHKLVKNVIKSREKHAH